MAKPKTAPGSAHVPESDLALLIWLATGGSSLRKCVFERLTPERVAGFACVLAKRAEP